MGLKQSSPTEEINDYRSSSPSAVSHGYSSTPGRPSLLTLSAESVGTAVRTRALSLGNFISSSINDTLSLNSSTSGNTGLHDATPGDSDEYSTDDEAGLSPSISTASLPTHLTFYQDIKCPVCRKHVPADNVEVHLLMCLTKPQIVYNDDVLTEDKGECSICFEDLQQGDTIARLPCLCIYHKGCIEQWFAVNRICPEHPGD